ncbi:MFS transporter [Actinoplanes sp. TBRC 11911]|uniref:MFS transporter n=1 Tax=Actinoplanes sp. TBRC 11911 TaxID=2729386 RepID=UPI00145DDB1D|nr:MFS transporter [Actinoplanes sp. TBRC 11911]NMO55843.1 MFS transporter [Actinoplanes sp. TBRC 11911]
MTSLWQNREFNLLWSSQSLSDLGGTIAQLAVPLLVLEVTDSAVLAGAVGTAAQVAKVLARLPSGVLADLVNRRRTMLICDVIRLFAFAVLTAAVATGHAGLALITIVAVVDAACGSLFNTTEHAALRSIVPARQLPDAVARNEARSYGTTLAGPPLGGLLFGVTHALPFLGNALSYLVSLIGITMIRKPLQAARREPPAGHAAALAEGLRFVFTNPFLRAVVVIAAPLNLALTGTTFTIILTLQHHRVEPGVIGLTETIIGVGGLAGAFAAPLLQRVWPFAKLIRYICWAATGVIALSALFTATLAAAVPVALAVFLGPSCNAALFGYQAAITPDRLQGRVLSVIFLAAMSVATVAPLLAGVLVTTLSSEVAVLFFAAVVTISGLTATFAPGIRTMRPLEGAARA